MLDHDSKSAQRRLRIVRNRLLSLASCMPAHDRDAARYLREALQEIALELYPPDAWPKPAVGQVWHGVGGETFTITRLDLDRIEPYVIGTNSVLGERAAKAELFTPYALTYWPRKWDCEGIAEWEGERGRFPIEATAC